MDIRPIDANALKQHQKMLVEHMDGYDVAYNAVPMHRVDELPTLSLNILRDEIYEDAVAHGLWEDVEKDSIELSEEEPPSKKEEAYTFHRRVYATKLVFLEGDELLCAAEESDWDALQEELADVVIQAFSTAGYLGIDINAAIRRKMEINKKRPWKHGKE